MIREIEIDSSALSEANYNTDTKELNIKFNGSNTFYTSYDVPEGVIDAFENAGSQVQYWNNHIKGKYE